MGVSILTPSFAGHIYSRFPSDAPVYRETNYMNVLDVYASYVNKFVDHRAFEVAF